MNRTASERARRAPALAWRALAMLWLLGAVAHGVVAWHTPGFGRPQVFYLLLGLAYDGVVAAAGALLVYLAALLRASWGSAALVLLTALLALFNLADFHYFLQFRTHLPFSAVAYLREAGVFLPSLWRVLSGWSVPLLLLLPVALAGLLARQAAHRSRRRHGRSRVPGTGRHAAALVGLLLLGTLLSTLANSYVAKNQADPLQLSPLHHFLFTRDRQERRPVRLPAALLRQVPEGQPFHPLLRNVPQDGCARPPAPLRGLCTLAAEAGGRPNLVFVMLESFRAHEVGTLGGPPGLTPRFDAAAAEGVLFENFFANGFQTRDGLLAAHCGLLPNFGPEVLSRYPTVRLRCLPEVLAARGYASLWLHNGDAGFDAMRPFLLRAGFDRVLDQFDFPVGTERLGWGYGDAALMDKVVAEMQALPEPFFVSLLGMTNHHPFEVPPRFRTHRAEGLYGDYRNGLHYTDAALGRLLDQLRAQPFAKRTLVFIFADHSLAIPPTEGRTDGSSEVILRHRIPLLVLAPGLPGTRVRMPASQMDLPLLALDLTAGPAPRPLELPWRGRSPLSAGTDGWVLMHRPGGYWAAIGLAGSPEGATAQDAPPLAIDRNGSGDIPWPGALPASPVRQARIQAAEALLWWTAWSLQTGHVTP